MFEYYVCYRICSSRSFICFRYPNVIAAVGSIGDGNVHAIVWLISYLPETVKHVMLRLRLGIGIFSRLYVLEPTFARQIEQ